MKIVRVFVHVLSEKMQGCNKSITGMGFKVSICESLSESVV